MSTGFNTQTGNDKYRLQFETDNKEHFLLMQKTARLCVDGKPQTNEDRIRAMSDEELADWLGLTITDTVWNELGKRGISFSRQVGLDACNQMLEWLKQPAEGDGNNGSTPLPQVHGYE